MEKPYIRMIELAARLSELDKEMQAIAAIPDAINSGLDPKEFGINCISPNPIAEITWSLLCGVCPNALNCLDNAINTICGDLKPIEAEPVRKAYKHYLEVRKVKW